MTTLFVENTWGWRLQLNASLMVFFPALRRLPNPLITKRIRARDDEQFGVVGGDNAIERNQVERRVICKSGDVSLKTREEIFFAQFQGRCEGAERTIRMLVLLWKVW